LFCGVFKSSNDYRRILGVPLKGTTAYLLAPGVGCSNACRFCSTSHFFGQSYLPFIRTVKDVALSFMACFVSRLWSWRLRLFGDRIQPRTIVTHKTSPLESS
jgi:hypothetical protein